MSMSGAAGGDWLPSAEQQQPLFVRAYSPPRDDAATSIPLVDLSAGVSPSSAASVGAVSAVGSDVSSQCRCVKLFSRLNDDADADLELIKFEPPPAGFVRLSVAVQATSQHISIQCGMSTLA